jgi:hypothetical protein
MQNLIFLSLLATSLLFQPAQPEFRPNKPLPDSPDDAAFAAAQFLQSALKVEQSQVAKGGKVDRPSSRLRFLSLYDLPTRGSRRRVGGKIGEVEPYSPLDDTIKILLFVINQTNRINSSATLIRIKDDLFAVDYLSPGWSPEAWDRLAANDVYFKREWIQESTWNYLTYYTYSQYPIMRADQFISLSMLPPAYYDLLGLPDNLAALQKLIGIDDKLLTETYRTKGSVKTDNLSVTLNNRILERRQGAFNLWTSNDVVNSKGRKNALRQLDVISGDIHKLDIDGQEHFFQLNNGLWGYYLNNAQGKRVDEVPINIARDENFRDYRVIAGRSCAACHIEGIRPFQSDQASLLSNQVVTLRTINPEDANALAARYDEKIVQRFIRTDQTEYRSAIEDLVGVTPEKISFMFANAWRVYNEERVTLHQAAIECGLYDAGLIAVATPSIDPNILKFLELDDNKQPRTLSRDVFEDIFDELMLLRGRPTLKDGQIPMPAVSGERRVVTPKIVAIEPVKPVDDPEIIGKLVLKKPGVIGENQTGEVTLKSKNPFIVKTFSSYDKTVILAGVSQTPVNEQILSFTFIYTQAGFPKEISVGLDNGKTVKIPIEEKN